jgi:hypothetical protein
MAGFLRKAELHLGGKYCQVVQANTYIRSLVIFKIRLFARVWLLFYGKLNCTSAENMVKLFKQILIYGALLSSEFAYLREHGGVFTES